MVMNQHTRKTKGNHFVKLISTDERALVVEANKRYQ